MALKKINIYFFNLTHMLLRGEHARLWWWVGLFVMKETGSVTYQNSPPYQGGSDFSRRGIPL